MQASSYQPPLVSIILVTYNAKKYIQDCLENIQNYVSDNVEVVIVDGCSTDGTIDTLNEKSHLINQLLIEKDNGIYDAMNKAIRLAKGDFLYFIGADDLIMDGFLSVKKILKNKDTIYYGDVLFSNIGETYAGEFNKRKIIEKNICHQAIFYPRQIFSQYTYDTNYKLMADYILNIQLFGDKNYKFQYCNYIIATYSNIGLSTLNKEKKFAYYALYLVAKHLGIKYLILKLWARFTSGRKKLTHE